MLFFNIKNQAFEHPQYIQCSQCHQVAVTAHTQLKFVRFGLIPLFPFALERASYCANCSAKNVPENSQNSKLPIFHVLTKFIGTVLIILMLSWLWQQHTQARNVEINIVNQPQINDFFFIDYSKFLKEEYYQKRVVAAKVIATENDTVTLKLGRYNYSRERDLKLSARSDNFVQKGYFFTDSQTFSQQQIKDFYDNNTIYAAYRPKDLKLFGGFVVMPSNPKPLYAGFKLNKANQEGIAAYQEKDFSTAFEYFSEAAEQGDSWGQYNLAKMYLAGEGTDKNRVQAGHWLTLSAKQGHSKAQQLCDEKGLCQ